MLDFPLMLQVKLSVVDRIHPQSTNCFTDMENKATDDLKVNESPDSLFVIWPVVSKLLVFVLTGTAYPLLHCSRFHLEPWWNLCQCGMYS